MFPKFMACARITFSDSSENGEVVKQYCRLRRMRLPIILDFSGYYPVCFGQIGSIKLAYHRARARDQRSVLAAVRNRVCVDTTLTASFMYAQILIRWLVIPIMFLCTSTEGWEAFYVSSPAFKIEVIPPAFLSPSLDKKAAPAQLHIPDAKPNYCAYTPWSSLCPNLSAFVSELVQRAEQRPPLVVLPSREAAVGLAHLIFKTATSHSDGYYVTEPEQALELLTVSKLDAQGRVQATPGALKKSIEKGKRIVLIVDLNAFEIEEFSLMLGMLDSQTAAA